MTQLPKDTHKNPEQTYPSTREEVNKKKQQAEEHEIAGRHKNNGQKDHKGAR